MEQISTQRFYGVSDDVDQENSLTPKKCDPRLDLRNRRISLLDSPPRTWRVFTRQEPALAMARRKPSLTTFVFHAVGTGQRLFLVAHAIEFWLHDIRKKPAERCSYEIITEFMPCKLYLDLEFERQFNPDHNGEAMTETFIKAIAFQLNKIYHLQIDRKMILDLDSSTKEKFSRHLIYQIPFISFANNYQVGYLVREVCHMLRQPSADLAEKLGCTQQELANVMVKDRHGNLRIFCDEGVYTKNRHFRLFGSTKPHKNAHLIPSPQNLFTACMGDPDLENQHLFLSSLITNFEPMSVVVSLPERFPTDDGHKITVRRFPSRPLESSSSSGLKTSSPYPCVDTFVSNLMFQEGVRDCVYYPKSRCLVYCSQRPCYCGNVGREHRSNKGMLVVDLTKNQFYRKCHDPDCISYQSEAEPLPNSVTISLKLEEYPEEVKQDVEELLNLLESQNDSVLMKEDQEEEGEEKFSQELQVSSSVPQKMELLQKVNSINQDISKSLMTHESLSADEVNESSLISDCLNNTHIDDDMEA